MAAKKGLGEGKSPRADIPRAQRRRIVDVAAGSCYNAHGNTRVGVDRLADQVLPSPPPPAAATAPAFPGKRETIPRSASIGIFSPNLKKKKASRRQPIRSFRKRRRNDRKWRARRTMPVERTSGPLGRIYRFPLASRLKFRSALPPPLFAIFSRKSRERSITLPRMLSGILASFL